MVNGIAFDRTTHVNTFHSFLQRRTLRLADNVIRACTDTAAARAASGQLRLVHDAQSVRREFDDTVTTLRSYSMLAR